MTHHRRITPLAAASWCCAAAGILVCVIACLVLVGWVFDLDGLKSVSPGMIAMKVNTAVAFILAAVPLLLVRAELPGRSRQRAVRLCATGIALIGGLTLCEYLFGWDLGIDQLLLREPPGAPGAYLPGRMAPQTAASFLALGGALLVLDTRRGAWIAQSVALAVVLTALVALVGYVYHVSALYVVGPYVGIALNTTLNFIIVSVGILCARPACGMMALVVSETAGGVTVRRLLPVAIAAPVLLGLAIEGLYGPSTGVSASIHTVSLIVVFGVLVLWNGYLLHRSDLERTQAEQHVRQLNAALDQRVQERTADLTAAVAALEDEVIARKRAEGVIRQSAAEIEDLYNRAPCGYHSLDAEGVFVRINDTELSWLGYTRDEIIGRMRLTDLLTPDSLRTFEENFPQLKARGWVYNLEFEILRKDGTRLPALVNATAIRDRDGNYVMSRSTVWDLTERKRVERDLQRTAVELARSNDELQQFAYTVSHDLQEPLRIVTNYVQLLAQRYTGKLDTDADEFIAFAVDAAARMHRLIDDLLRYSRVGTGGKHLVLTDCEHLLTEVLEGMATSDALITHDPLPMVMADDVQLGQVLQNLIGNAIKFRGEAPPRVHVSTARDDGSWRFAVRDNGIGIDPQHFERIFLIFQRLHGRAAYPGTGVGLAICKRIVERHGGRIWVESAPGQGATFFFTIPDEPGGCTPEPPATASSRRGHSANEPGDAPVSLRERADEPVR